MQEPVEVLVGHMLRARNLTLATAESCTGGLVGHLLTEVPGSSDYFLGGIVAYSNEVKTDILGVRPETLEVYGAVSQETAREMAEGVRAALKASVGLAVTGIAGPTSDQSEKPVGLTWLALSTEEGIWTESHQWEGDRQQNKAQSAEAALGLLLRFLGDET
ncbi:MAG: nicotinamide-nucleotide amidohydrolase family protein [Anaerolineales bacterium]|nr:nicotinamide-nucleotide amidohydrolase family protein [Anaerolineales bacterium]